MKGGHFRPIGNGNDDGPKKKTDNGVELGAFILDPILVGMALSRRYGAAFASRVKLMVMTAEPLRLLGCLTSSTIVSYISIK
ncbi:MULTISPECIES: hypothetical protein [Cytobacillus]|uniref:Uncharacterized protein n=1 Tax=Cytobacillus firmus DS1 TaxID=1307436 RepID=W7KLR1_CYTFI|nr:hypothetical protein [Cytobacillus firmus]EWG08335.1 hypothetical protein PBF_24758 [Cytobacillus firmus DS1]MBG9550273.1 hypothetical protein [Cytobacillus firmus]MBG9605434.1 hypothetical protein [Cytobacillus firmus]MED1942968.1 hypothetical protein [Cytobacillus firmus]